jgi:hypothetical protein
LLEKEELSPPLVAGEGAAQSSTCCWSRRSSVLYLLMEKEELSPLLVARIGGAMFSTCF